MGLVKNAAQVDQALGLFVDRYKHHTLAYFKACVWDLFENILLETPQFSGKAVANWNLSVGAPNNTYDPIVDIEAPQKTTPSGFISQAGVKERGHPYWMEYSWRKNRPVVNRIRLDSRVFITNAAVGDSDHGKSSEIYLESLQDPGYWSVKLRAVNKPYETVAETILKFNERKISEGLVAPFL